MAVTVRFTHYPEAGYSKAETDDKIAHFLGSGTKPMTCAKIAEGGFRCPRLGECGCNTYQNKQYFRSHKNDTSAWICTGWSEPKCKRQ